jgi:hypothetical protein
MNRARATGSRIGVAVWLLAGMVVLAGATTPARGDAMYNVTNLGALTPVGLDNQGQVYLNQAGSSPYHIPNPNWPYRDNVAYTELDTARRYQPSGSAAGTFTDLGANVTKGTNQLGSSINPASSQVVSVDANGQALVTNSQGAYLTDGTTVTKVDVPASTSTSAPAVVGVSGGVATANYGHTTDITNGWRQDVVTIQNGSATTLAFPGGQQGVATAVGGGGQVVGQMWSFVPGLGTQNTAHAFLAQNGKVTDLGTLGGTWSRPTGVNAAGQVVGVCPTPA